MSRSDELKKKVDNDILYWDDPTRRPITDLIVKKSIIYNDMYKKPLEPTMRTKSTKIIITERTTQSAIFTNGRELGDRKSEESYVLCALNFASFKSPGGGYINGMMAQEEALCHASNLYLVLKEFQSNYYDPNKRLLNKGMYQNRMVYSPGVLFRDSIFPKSFILCDVITAACPNRRAAEYFIQSNRLSEDEFVTSIANRIDSILRLAVYKSVTHLILGAYGCGVFRNDPRIIATLFKSYLYGKYRNYFDYVEFAVPKSTRDNNHKIFHDVFYEDDNQKFIYIS